MKINFRSLVMLILSIAAAQAAGLIGSLVTIEAIPTWYAALTKPDFNPPNWIFGPVWTLLYTLMGISAWLVWQKRTSAGVSSALWLYVIHLAVNALWSHIFFGWQRLDLAFMTIIVLWTMIACMMVLFKRFSPAAAWLLVPYLSWVSFALILNYSLWRLN